MPTFKWSVITVGLLFIHHLSSAQQLSLGKTPHLLNKAAVLDLNSDNQGLLLPRIADTSLINVLNPQDGMLIYFTPAKQLLVRANGAWQALSSTNLLKNYWSVNGNTNGIPGRIGTADNYDLPFITNNTERLRITNAGTVGIGTPTPSTSTRLDVNGPVKLGARGNVVNNVLAFEYTFPAPQAVAAGTAISFFGVFSSGSTDITIPLPATLNSTRATVAVSPNFDLPPGVSIASAYATSTTAIKIRLVNASSTTQTFSTGSKLYITIIDF